MHEIIDEQLLLDTLSGVKAEQIEQLFQGNVKLPPMPEMAPQLLSLLSSPYSDAVELSALVEKDPHLTAQIIRFCQSAFSGYRGNIESIQDAINRVLGFEVTCNLVLGIVLGSKLKLEQSGPLGGKVFWGNALACGELAKQLLTVSSIADKDKPPIGYLAGMLHHLGFALFNLLMKDLFTALNQIKQKNMQVPLSALEQQCYGELYPVLNHGEFAARLMESWKLPTPIIIAARHQHNYQYQGAHQTAVWSVQLADMLLSEYQLSDEQDSELQSELIAKLQIEPEKLANVIQRFESGIDDLKKSVSVLAK